jgi:hypothetical protein
MFAGFVDPPVSSGIRSEVKEESEQRKTIVPAESEGNRIRRKGIGEGTWVVVDTPDRLRGDLRYRFGILSVPEQVRRDSRRPGDRETPYMTPLAITDWEQVDPHIWTSCLVAVRHRELMLISWKVSQFVNRCCGPM